MLLVLRLSALSVLTFSSLSNAAPASSCPASKTATPSVLADASPPEKTYVAVSRARITGTQAGGYGGQTYGRGFDQKLRQNGTYCDVGVWTDRKVSKEPFHFTLGPGRDDKTHTIVQVPAKEGDEGARLAYTQSDTSLPINQASIAAFILLGPDEGNTDTQIFDDWTVDKDEAGRLVLGLGEVKGKPEWSGLGGHNWTLAGCAWNGEDDHGSLLCDGFYFINPPGFNGFGMGDGAVIELVEYEDKQ